MFQNLVPQKLVPDILALKKGKKIKGMVVLMKKNVLDFNSVGSSVFDRLSEFAGHGVTIQLISAAHADSDGFKGKLGKPASLEGWITTHTHLKAGQSPFTIRFEWDGELGVPGAFLIRNNHLSEFFLVSLTLEDVPNQGDIHFVCNSWIYPSYRYKSDRIFFRNKSYLPSETPEPLRKYREEELLNLRGDGTGKREEWERIYDYDVYNDLGNPDKGSERVRPIIGGSSTFPYPRRGRTGRPPTKSDPCSETRKGSFYIPRDEKFGVLKNSDFLTYQLKSITHDLGSRLRTLPLLDNEFNSFEDVLGLYNGRFKLPERILKAIRDNTHAPILKEILRTDGQQFLSFPLPQVIKENSSGWMSDEEFARQMLAGVNPCLICCLREFPPRSKLDNKVYGDHTSTIAKEHIEINLDGLTVDEAIEKKRLFILDHHDPVMPYLWLINTTTPSKTYAARTVLFLKEDGTLKPLAIELSLPPQNGDQFDKESEVYLPAEHGADSVLWLLAKAYVVVNDSGYHQLISHWLNTHAVIEPFVIATNRHLSVLHPIHKLLLPHYRDTMNINALARKSLINAGGIIESTFLSQRFSMEMCSMVYKNWVFPEQALPVDLIKRGMAVEDPASPHGLRLVIEDYPFAVDGLEIWFAIKIWVQDYCFYYYETDETVKNDSELQSWWKEVIEVGHGDKKAEPWWFKMQTRQELVETCTIIIWIASALHAAVNFGQYPYGGYILNRPTLSRRFMPKKGTPEYDEFVKDPQKAYLKTITAKKETLMDLSVLEMLSTHTSDEIYLGQRDSDYWTSDAKALEAFSKFQKEIEEIGKRIIKRNSDGKLKNRFGTVKMPYTLLFPTSEVGLTGKGIPNSISI